MYAKRMWMGVKSTRRVDDVKKENKIVSCNKPSLLAIFHVI